jgi:hypothetical protein
MKKIHSQPGPSTSGPPISDLRHSAATLALAAGANTRELMERMGHTSPAVALRYQHVMAGRDQAIAAALDEPVQAAANLPADRPRSLLKMPAPVRRVVSATGPEAAEWEGARSSP